MTQTISISDFTFFLAGYGHYRVTYRSPVTGKTWTNTTSEMWLIDETKNAEAPTKVALNRLKRMCKKQ